jgi:hypothetical protein
MFVAMDDLLEGENVARTCPWGRRQSRRRSHRNSHGQRQKLPPDAAYRRQFGLQVLPIHSDNNPGTLAETL